jgi:ataxia telangiectasia mutated family protein
MIHSELVNRALVLENTGAMLSSISTNGPAVFCDSAATFLQTIMTQLQRESISMFGERAEQVLSWAFRTWAPRNFHDRIFASQNTNNEIADIMGLIDVCVGLPAGIESTTSLPIWESVAQSWILHEQTRDLLDYLLPRKKSSFLDTKLDKTVKQSDTNMPINKVNGSLLLGLYTTETSATVEKWENLKDHSLDRHMLRMVATLAITGLCFANCLETSDMHRAEQLRASNSRLMELLFSDLSSPTCEISKIDCLLDLFAHGLVSESHRINVCVSKIAGRLLNILEDRRETIQPDSAIQRNDSSDIMDFDTDFESQLTTHATPVREIWPPRKVISNNYSASAQRASVTIYAKLMHALSLSDKESNDSIAETFIARILELPTSEILASGPLLTTLPHYGIKLTPKQFEPLLEFFADNTLSSYLYERAETNMDLLLGVMDSFVQAWTDSSEPDFYVFGLDIYKWFTVTAMKAGLLSPCVQKRLVGLLLQILQIDVDYGKTDNLPSVQSTLFRLMKEGNLEVKYCIAQELSSVFKLFPLPVHADILRELIDSLPLETTWIEGMAVRVMVLARLAASWHSLRMRCIYHIFEAAGMMPDLVKFSAASVVTISDELHLKSPQEVFKLFSSQILYTWFEGHAVAELPFEVFGYQDMTDLLNHNLDEVYAQLVIRGKAEEIQWVLEKLKSTEGKVLRSTFSKTLAYTISWDVCEGQGTSQDPSQVATPCESRLRGILKTNAEYYTLVQFNLPDILAQLFASAYHEDAIEKVFEKRSEYGYAKDALSAMKQYGSLDKELPEAQQPRFKGRYLVDQLERACRRTGNKTFKTIKDVLDVPHITVSLGSIIDCMHPAYGPLHACHIVRKLRIFIALAGDDIFQGYPLQTLIRVLKSIIIDPHCSDDSMGVLRYLLERGKDFLRQEISMVTGTILLILLSLKQFMTSRQDKTTQESQYRNTVSKMQTFHDWLVGYLLEFKSALDSRQQAAFCSLVESCRDLELPSTSSTNEVASTMLKGLLDDEECDLPILGPTERKQVVTTLCLHYRTTNWAAQDMFDSDKLSVSYARRVWASIQTTVVADNYRAWAARVLGRAYASTVSLEQIRPTQGLMSHLSVGTGEQNQSTRAIVTKINNLLSSEDRTHVGVAEQSLRKISDRFAALEDHEGAIEFERILPAHVVSAISRAYSKDVPEIKDSEKLRREELWQATRLDPDVPFESWVQNLAASICRWATENPVIGQLERFFRSTNGFSHELFPFIVHLALSFEVEKEQVVRTYLSESFTTHFKSHGINIDSKSRLLLETLLYLLTQPLPGERTRMGRLEWLELDYLLAAEAAGRCNMPTAALYLGEIAAVPECDPRPSRRSLINPVVSKGFSNELLLSIYSRVDDPDSFYGVKQPPSLESVLARVHHEGDGLKGLMLHSARMDAAMRKSGQPDENDSFGLIGSIGTMNLSSLTHDLLHRKGGNQSTVSTTDTMLDAARKLEQWDISTPQTNNSAASTLYCAFRGLSSAVNLESVQLNLNEALGLSIRHLQDPRLDVSAVRSTLSGIAVLNEISELTAVRCSADLGHLWDRMQARQRGWDIGRYVMRASFHVSLIY